MTSSYSCQACDSSEVQEGYEVALCAACRSQLVHTPFPLWIKVGLVVILVVVVFSFSRFARDLEMGRAYEQASKEEARAQYNRAAEHYRMVLDSFPDSTPARARLGIALFRAGQVEEALTVWQPLQGQKLSRTLQTEINGLLQLPAPKPTKKVR